MVAKTTRAKATSTRKTSKKKVATSKTAAAKDGSSKLAKPKTAATKAAAAKATTRKTTATRAAATKATAAKTTTPKPRVPKTATAAKAAPKKKVVTKAAGARKRATNKPAAEPDVLEDANPDAIAATLGSGSAAPAKAKPPADPTEAEALLDEGDSDDLADLELDADVAGVIDAELAAGGDDEEDAEAEEDAPNADAVRGATSDTAPTGELRLTGDPVTDAAARLGIERLHDQQREAISQVIAGRDVLMILPTGFGKSACYQVPSMVMDKPVVMISPLLALLKDQHDILVSRGIDCVRIDGSVRARARREALARISEGGPLLVMTTPETLAVEDVSEALTKTGVGLAAVDEAHCISEWGHDFRPAYRRLGKRLRSLGGPPILALTATATPRVRDAIMESLALRDPHLISSSPHRSNLAFEVIHCEGDMRLRALIRLLKRLRRPGIVYCSTRREVDTVYAVLRRFNIPGHRYHGAMTSSERNSEQKKFMSSRNRSVMAATSAFGLGIDKRDIRYILHYQAPASLEQYVQEAGRGGRDGKKSNCILLNDPADRRIHEALLARSRVRPDQLYQLGMAIAAWSDEERSPSIEALALSADLGPRTASALLAKVEEAELVEIEDHEVHVISDRATIEADVNSLAGQFETLKTQDGRRLDSIAEYADKEVCRAVFLRGYFGEEEHEEDPCGLCDVCRGRPERPDEFFAPLAPPPTRKKKGRKKKQQQQKKRGGRRSRRGKGGDDSKRRPATAASAAAGGAAGIAGTDGNADAGQQRQPGQPGQPGQGRRRRRGRGRRRKGAAENSAGNGAAPKAAAPADPNAAANPKRRRRRRRRRGGARRPEGDSSGSPPPAGDGA